MSKRAIKFGAFGAAVYVITYLVLCVLGLAQAPFPNTAGTSGPGPAGGITQLTADVLAGPGSGSQAAALSTTGATAGTYGDSTHVGQFTVDAKGRISAASNVGIAAGGGGGLTWLGTRTASASTELDFVSLITSTYDDYLLVFTDLQVSVAGVPIAIQYSTNNGVSYDTANNYGWSNTNVGGIGGTSTGANGNTPWGSMILFSDSAGVGQPSTAGPGLQGTIWLKALNSSNEKLVFGDGIARYNGTGFIYRWECGMLWNQSTVVNAVRVIPSNGGAISGNFPSGSVKLYGLQRM